MLSAGVAAAAQTPAAAPSAAAANPPAAAPDAAAVPPAPCCTLPSLTPVALEILVPISSKLNKIGEHFAIRLASPITVAEGLQIPAGTQGQGDVIHAAKSGMGGRPGELILAARYLDFGGTHIPLRSLSYTGGHGQGHSDTAAAFAIAGGVAGSVIAMFITGGEVNIPAGTIVYAKTAAAVTLPLATTISTAPPATGAQSQ